MAKHTSGKRLNELRTSKNLTQQQIADRLGIARAYWTSLESGTRKLTGGVIRSLVEEFSVSIDWLMSGGGKSQSQNDPISTSKMDKVIEEKRKSVSTLYYKLVQIIELTEKTFGKNPACDRYLENIKKIISYVDASPVEKLSFDKKSQLIHQLDSLLMGISKDFDDLFDKYHRDYDHPKRRIKFEAPSNVLKLSAVVDEIKNPKS